VTSAIAGLPNQNTDDPKRVVYLLGAGATHGCARFLGSTNSLIMPGLIEQLGERMRDLVQREYRDHAGIIRLVNDVVDQNTDFEQLITFLEDATSEKHRSFAVQLKGIFSSVLRERLDEVRRELGERHSELYATLLDMHDVAGLEERLDGFLTLNYDVFLEHAIEIRLGYSVGYGVAVRPETYGRRSIRVLKMHGSFGWADGWPIEVSTDEVTGLWIPPGIRKAKTEYPFNAIWGMARELLDCDILRIIGCNLGPNDWDLVSLLFTTMHTNASAGYAKEQAAAQVLLQVFSRSEGGEFVRARHFDLQRFVKAHADVTEIHPLVVDVALTLDALQQHLGDVADLLRNRAMTVSVIILAWERVLHLDLKLMTAYSGFIGAFLGRLRWQVNNMKAFEVDDRYAYLVEFQRHLTQASVEKPAVTRRHELLDREWDLWLADGCLTGDAEYTSATGFDPPTA
jgi:hypothetical protein